MRRDDPRGLPDNSVFTAALVGAIECPGGKLGYDLRLSALVAVVTVLSAGGAAGDAVDVRAKVGTERWDCWTSAAVAVGDGRAAQGRHFKGGRNEAENLLAINFPANSRAWCGQSLGGARMRVSRTSYEYDRVLSRSVE
jgi:hypothetical protein